VLPQRKERRLSGWVQRMSEGTPPKARGGRRKLKRRQSNTAAQEDAPIDLEAAEDIAESAGASPQAADTVDSSPVAAPAGANPDKEPATDFEKTSSGRGRGRGGRGRGRGQHLAKESDAPDSKIAEDGKTDAAAQEAKGTHSLSSNIQQLRFMQTAVDEERRKRQEQDQLRHREEMQWIVPGFEAEVAAENEKLKEKRPAEGAAQTPQLHLFRRSYKGVNPVIEQLMKDQLKKHADAIDASKELEQVMALNAMRKKRMKQ